jgi:hypothetical protein
LPFSLVAFLNTPPRVVKAKTEAVDIEILDTLSESQTDVTFPESRSSLIHECP